MKFILFILVCWLPFSLCAYEGDGHHHEEHGHEEHHHDESFAEHAAHVHGHANANISYVDNTLIVALNLAAKDVFGFEHAPKNNSEEQIVTSSLLYLKDINDVLTTQPACRVGDIVVESDIVATREHEHSDDEVHSDVDATYELHCESDVKLTFTLLQRFKSIEKILVQYVSSSEQSLITATHDKATILLHK